MHSVRVTGLLLALVSMLAPAPAAGQSATTAAIAGVVKDATGAVLPGVTVEASSPALIEKVRSAVSDSSGNYKVVDLRPGTYAVTFTLPGFGTLKREGLELTTGITANVNADLKVGSLEETVTVTGASPVVDIQNVRSQTVLTREVLDALPTNKTLQSYAALTLGASMGSAANQDVGGNQGEAGGFGYFAVHGGRGNDQRMTVEGMHFYALIGNGAAGNRTNYVNQMAVAETTIQTGGFGAEAETGGVAINIVPKDGGNSVSGSGVLNGTSGRFQSSNLDDNLRARGITVSPKVKAIYDQGVGFGGPIVKDKVWFYTAHRRWGSQNTVPGLFFNATPHTGIYTADTSRPAYTWIHNRDHQGRITWQITPKQKLTASQGFQWDVNEYYEVERGRAPEAAARLVWSPNSLTQAVWNYPRTNRLLFEAGQLVLWEDQSNYPVANGDARPGDISIAEIGGGIPNVYNARALGLGQTDYAKGDRVHIAVQRFAVSYVTGSHAVKVGINSLYSPAKTGAELFNIPGYGPISYRYLNGVPFQLTQWRSPRYYRNRVSPLMGIFGQDQWTMKQLTLTLGVRYDYIHSYDPEETLPAIPEFGIPALSFPKVDNVPNWKTITPRLGAAYDIFGNGKTAVKFSLGRYNLTETNGLAQSNAPANRIALSTNRSWTDTNGNRLPECSMSNPATNGECGPWLTPSFGQPIPATTFDPDLLVGWNKRDYNWQTTLTLQQELFNNVALNVGYFRTTFGKFRATANRAAAAVGFDQYCITVPTDAALGTTSGRQLCGFYDAKAVVAPDNFVTFADNFGKQTEAFDGIDVSVQARFGKGGLIQGGVSTGRTVTDNCDVVRNHPEIALSISTGFQSLQGSGTGSRTGDEFCHVVNPWSAQTQLKAAVNYPLPLGVNVSGTLQNLPGIPIYAVQTVTSAQTTLGRNLTTGSVGIMLNVPYTSFEDRMNQVDLRFTKNVQLWRARVQGQFDIYNAFNANTILLENVGYTATWRRPQAILGARLFKFGLQVDF